MQSHRGLGMVELSLSFNIPEGTFIRFLNDFFDKHIDVKTFEKKRNNDWGGKPAKHCLMMLKIIFYAFSMGIYSMRELSKQYLMKHIDFIQAQKFREGAEGGVVFA